MMGSVQKVHPGYVSRKGDGMFPGRVWVNHKIMSFWEYPTREMFLFMMEEMNEKLKEYYPEHDWILLMILHGK